MGRLGKSIEKAQFLKGGSVIKLIIGKYIDACVSCSFLKGWESNQKPPWLICLVQV